jgi:hypothetical protein
MRSLSSMNFFFNSHIQDATGETSSEKQKKYRQKEKNKQVVQPIDKGVLLTIKLFEELV